MCRKIVEHHGGTIWLDAEHTGPGSTFRFTLPAREPADPEPASPHENREGPE
jgi:signal transduction histidine kinase